MNTTVSDRQIEIIEAAAKLLTNSGVSGLTIKNLAKEMKFSESAIYRHFESKEDIILSMLDFVLSGAGKATFIVMDSSLSTTEIIKTMFLSQFSYFSKHPHLAVAIFSDGLLEASERINSKILDIMNSRKIILEPLVKEAQNKGEFTNEIAVEEIIHILMGSVRLLMYQWRVSYFRFDLYQKGEKLLDSILKLIVA